MVCHRTECVYHGGEVRAAGGRDVPGCGRQSVSFDEGECKDFFDAADVRPGDLEMSRGMAPMGGFIGPWQYKIRGDQVVMDTFAEASSKVGGLHEGFADAVRDLAKNEFAPAPSMSALEEARLGRDRSQDVQAIVDASKDAGPGDVIVFDEATGGAEAMSRSLAKDKGYIPAAEQLGPGVMVKGAPRFACRIDHDRMVVRPETLETAVAWLAFMTRQSLEAALPDFGDAEHLRRTFENGLVGCRVPGGVIQKAHVDEGGGCSVTVQMDESIEMISLSLPPLGVPSFLPVAAERGPAAELQRVESPEAFQEACADVLHTITENTEPSRFVEVDGVRVEVDSMPGELKERVSEKDAITLIEESEQAQFDLEDLEFRKALAWVRCSECARRPQGTPVTWAAGLRTGASAPKCMGRSRWLGINRACLHFTSILDMGERLREEMEDLTCMNCGGSLEHASDGYYQCEICGYEEEDPFYDPPDDEWEEPDEDWPYDEPDEDLGDDQSPVK